MKKIHILLCLFVIGVLAISLTGCGKKNEEKYEITAIQDMKDLERDHFYVETEDGYVEPYWGETSFDPGYPSYSTSNVAWFDEENWNMIPTLYKGQCVVYRTIEEFDETFSFIKYLDEGYTLGICNLRETDTGRFKFDASEGSSNLCSRSDAYRARGAGGVVTIDAIDGEKLRANRISECGTILGLNKDQEYVTDIYAGTEILNAKFVADARALYECQEQKSLDYEFIQAEIIRIEIPEYFKTGYYSINGSGIFRYVDGNSYDENTNFNEMNPDSSMAAAQLEDINHYKEDVTDEVEFIAEGKYLVTLTYEDNVNEDLMDGKTIDELPLPSVYINTGEEEYTYLTNKGNNILEGEYEISAPGIYPIEINNIYGRSYNIETKKIEETSANNAEDTSEEIAAEDVEATD